jgi:hypothetical protein
MELTRAEHKFLITADEYVKLRFQLQQSMRLDTHADAHTNEYHLKSVYFDDQYDSRVFEKADGLEYHQKFRLRTYGNGATRLEYKTKIGSMTSKQDVWVDQELQHAILSADYDVLYRYLHEPLIEHLVVGMKLDDLKPAIIVDYDREAYVHKEGDVRITFDKNLTARRYDQVEAFDRRLFEPKFMMLEVKYTGLLPDFIRTLVFHKNHQPVAYSKYYAGWVALIH